MPTKVTETELQRILAIISYAEAHGNQAAAREYGINHCTVSRYKTKYKREYEQSKNQALVAAVTVVNTEIDDLLKPLISDITSKLREIIHEIPPEDYLELMRELRLTMEAASNVGLRTTHMAVNNQLMSKMLTRLDEMSDKKILLSAVDTGRQISESADAAYDVGMPK